MTRRGRCGHCGGDDPFCPECHPSPATNGSAARDHYLRGPCCECGEMGHGCDRENHGEACPNHDGGLPYPCTCAPQSATTDATRPGAVVDRREIIDGGLTHQNCGGKMTPVGYIENRVVLECDKCFVKFRTEVVREAWLATRPEIARALADYADERLEAAAVARGRGIKCCKPGRELDCGCCACHEPRPRQVEEKP